MPFEAMASAAARTTASLTLQAKWFQLFQPMGGVSASPGSCAGSGPPRLQRATAATKACPTQRTLLLLIITLLRKDVCKMVDGRAKDSRRFGSVLPQPTRSLSAMLTVAFRVSYTDGILIETGDKPMAHKSSSTLAETVGAALDSLQIELPSWGFADTGTRFGKFHQPAARTTEEKFADAGEVHKVTGACPT